MRIPPRARLIMWALMAIMLVAYFVIEPPDYNQAADVHTTAPSAADLVQRRQASAEEAQMDIAALGKQQLAKRLYLLDPQQQFNGVIAWWHDGHEEHWSYICGAHETYSSSIIALSRALQFKKVQIMPLEGDGDISQRLFDLPQPRNNIPKNWTLLERQ